MTTRLAILGWLLAASLVCASRGARAQVPGLDASVLDAGFAGDPFPYPPADAGVDASAQPGPIGPAELSPLAPAPHSELPAPPSDVASLGAIEVTVRDRSQVDRVRASLRAVKVIDTGTARRQSADVGELLARTEGVSLQRSGGLGSQTRLSLHGLTDDQIRVFLDGVPLDFSGFGLGAANVPVSWLERIEIYRGVLPVTYGVDALGGAIDFITDQRVRGSSAGASYMVGAFDTHQLALNARTTHRHGWITRTAAFFDSSRNDYLVDVRVPDSQGMLRTTRVRRFHDAYRGLGGSFETGVVNRPWAKRLLLRLFSTDFDKELQHNVDMTVPYGAVSYGQTTFGGTLRYELPELAGSPVGIALLAGYSRRHIGFKDVSRWVYDWFGNRVFEQTEGAGELSVFASDTMQWEDRVLARGTFSYALHPGHSLRLTVAPELAARSGEERLRLRAERLDPLTSERDLLQVVAGLEYLLSLGEDRLENSLFAKYYGYRRRADQVVARENLVRELDDTTRRFGAGDALRIIVRDGLIVKSSYEYATRLPRPDEVFGDGLVTKPSLNLVPESSHNGNLSLLVDQPLGARAGTLRYELSVFVRKTSDLILRMLENNRDFWIHQNIANVRAAGLDGLVHWVSPGEWLTLSANATWQDQRNVSERGPHTPFRGQRLANRPWLFANGFATLRVPRVGADHASLSLTWTMHYVYTFDVLWPDSGIGGSNYRIPTQLVHSANLTYSVPAPWRVDFSLDLQNLTDARAYDFLRVQKAGRAAFFKVSGCWACER